MSAFPQVLWLIYLAFLLLALGGGALLGQRVAERRREEIQTQAWEHGCDYGLRLAHHTVATYRKPWITLGEERGWDMAREQLRGALGELVEREAEDRA